MMNQSTATRAWEPNSIDSSSTDEVPQTPDWLLDDAARVEDPTDCAPDTIPSPPPDADEELSRMTIPAPPPVGNIGHDKD